MPGNRMTNFVPHDKGQPGLCFTDWKEAGEDDDLASWKNKGIVVLTSMLNRPEAWLGNPHIQRIQLEQERAMTIGVSDTSSQQLEQLRKQARGNSIKNRILRIGALTSCSVILLAAGLLWYIEPDILFANSKVSSTTHPSMQNQVIEISRKKRRTGAKGLDFFSEDIKESSIQGGKAIGNNLALLSFIIGIPLLLIGLYSLINLLFRQWPNVNTAIIIAVLLVNTIGILLVIGGYFVYKY